LVTAIACYPSTLISVDNLASLLKVQGKLAEAEPLYRRALEVEHQDTLISVNNLASLLKNMALPAASMVRISMVSRALARTMTTAL